MTRGFTLIESLVYVLVSILLIGISAHALMLFCHRMEDYGSETAEYLPIFNALQSMMRDIHGASQWNSYKSEKMIVSIRNQRCLWYFKEGRLVRLESGHAPSTLLYGVSKGLFTYLKNKEGEMRGVTCTISKRNSTFELFVACRTGLKI